MRQGERDGGGEALASAAAKARTRRALARGDQRSRRGAASERDRIFIRLLGDCGLRASELCSLEPGDIVRHDRQAYIRVRGKGERERLVPLPPAFLRRLDRDIRDTRAIDSRHDQLFLSMRMGRSGDYEPLTRNGLLQALDTAAKRAGLTARRVHPQLLRHNSFITNALRAGVNSLVLSRIVRHSSLRMIKQVYSHLNASDSYGAMIPDLLAWCHHRWVVTGRS